MVSVPPGTALRTELSRFVPVGGHGGLIALRTGTHLVNGGTLSLYVFCTFT